MVTSPEVIGSEHIVLVKGDVEDQEMVLCRIASKCVTSTAFGCSDCECADQIDKALEIITDAHRGVLIYLDQEGRGHGLATKIRAMNEKDIGFDTYSAVERLGLPADVRDYSHVPGILTGLGVHSIILLTNNPGKAAAIRSTGVEVAGVEPCRVDNPPARSLQHLEAKRRRGHLL
jgi:3,4-dihydroxy 2-butanone 4-phosphate synthase/GTP cyclohydrolase II